MDSTCLDSSEVALNLLLVISLETSTGSLTFIERQSKRFAALESTGHVPSPG